MEPNPKRIIIGISGGTGAVLAKQCIHILLLNGYQIELVITKPGMMTIRHELGSDEVRLTTPRDFVGLFPLDRQSQIRLHNVNDLSASIASGSYLTLGMIIIPSSMATVAAIACGLGDNLLRRAADVVIKERRRLVIVPREMPLSQIHLENLTKLATVGAIIAPPMPAWYTRPQNLAELETAIVGRILDAFGIYLDIYPRWGADESSNASERVIFSEASTIISSF